jgi:uncharacterized protein
MKWLALFAIRLYQRTISRVLPPSCRFVPSCSEYGYEAIARYGILRGGVMAVWRVMRCNPWGGHGYDPVPDLTKRAAGSGRQTVESRQKQETRDDRQKGDTQSSVLMPPKGHPQSYQDFALTPHAPGHSLTEGLP